MQNNENDLLEILNHIQKVDAPPYLMTRIREKLIAVKSNKISPKLAFALSLTFFLVVGLNAVILTKSAKESADQSFVKSLEIMPNNSIYHE